MQNMFKKWIKLHYKYISIKHYTGRDYVNVVLNPRTIIQKCNHKAFLKDFPSTAILTERKKVSCSSLRIVAGIEEHVAL